MSNTGLTLAGWRVIVIDDPVPEGEWARRYMRHAFAKTYTDFQKWAGPVGPSPDMTTIYFSEYSATMYVTQPVLDKLNNLVHSGAKIKMPHKLTSWSTRPQGYPYPDEEGGIDVFSI